VRTGIPELAARNNIHLICRYCRLSGAKIEMLMESLTKGRKQ